LNGGTHHYERFAPQNPDGNYDPTYGIREIISAHGGAYTVSEGTPDPNSLVYDDTSYGVLKLTLHANSYEWQFLPVADGIDPAGGSFTDSGSATCHGPPPALALPYRDQVLAASPASYWRLGEASGATASDELGVNPGTFSNVLLNQPGALTGDSNTSASFNGTSSYMTVPSASSLNMTTGGSVEFWAKRRSVSSTYQVVVGKPGDGLSRNENYSVWLGTTNKYTAYFGNGSSVVAVQTPAITDTNWHYIVATNDGSTAKIYVDGVLKQSAPMTIALTPNAKALNIGRAYNNAYFFNGWLDEVAVYPSALSSTTIQSHYSEGVSP
jgi:Concanavalin A-like lectin/glucanases superfamily